MENLTPLAEYGGWGICIALIILFGVILRKVFNLIGNHMNSNTEALTKVKDKLDEDIKAQKETFGALKELKEFLMFRNGKK